MSDDEQPFDAGDPIAVKQRRKSIGLAAREQGSALAAVMATRQGRAWMYSILVQCHIFSTSFHTNSMSMAFAEGERNIGLRLVADIQAHCAPRYSEMMQEANDVGQRTSSRRPNIDGSYDRRRLSAGSDSLLGNPIGGDRDVSDSA